MTEWLHFHFPLSCIREGNGNPLQCSCLENPRDGGAWWAAVYGITQSQTRLKRLSSSSSSSTLWKTQHWPQDLKRSVFIPIPKKGNAKECSNYHTIVLISHASKVMLKILQASLEQYMNQEIPDVQAGFRKGRETRDQIANIHWIIDKASRMPEKTYTSASLTMLKPLTV